MSNLEKIEELSDTRELADKYLDGKTYAEMVKGGAAQLRANAEEVNSLNVFPVPDGDTGDNMSMTVEGGAGALASVSPDTSLSEVSKIAAQGMLLGARGNSGVILSQFFAGIASAFEGKEKADCTTIGDGLKRGVKQAYAAVMTPTEGTILTVARESVDYAVSRISGDSTVTGIFADLIKEMYASLQRTPELLEQLKEAGVVDSGGAGLYYIMQGAYKRLIGEEIAESAGISAAPQAPSIDFSAFGPDSEMTFGYCTELLLRLQNSKVDTANFDEKVIKDFLMTVGDSIVAFKTDTIVKIHVHTKTPEKVLEFCRQFGEFLTVKIENMSVQHSNLSEEEPEKKKKPRRTKEFGTVAVASGDGIETLFRQLGVDAIVNGGQTNNPSAQDFLEAFDTVGASNIFVFPNNGNIVMAAKQAAQLYDGGKVYVIESKDLGKGYAAISSLNFQSGDPEKITATLNEAMSMVNTGNISPAVRDAEINGVHIENGDYIGFVGKEMMVSEKQMLDAAKGLLTKMSTDDVYLITAFVGKDATQADVDEITDWLSENYPDVEFYAVDGGQDVYPFIFVVE